MDPKHLEARIAALEELCAQVYQAAGTVGAPTRVLDNLWAAAQGQPLPHRQLLPITVEEFDEVTARGLR
jgi:hypothetical protein